MFEGLHDMNTLYIYKYTKQCESKKKFLIVFFIVWMKEKNILHGVQYEKKYSFEIT